MQFEEPPVSRPSSPVSSTPAAGSWIAVGTLVLGHVAFVATDARVCVDDVEMLSQVTPLLSGLSATETAAVLLGTGGWWEVCMAAWLAVAGVSPWAVRAPFVLATVWLVLNVGALLRWAASDRAAVAGMCLLSLAPMVTAWGRMAWYHVPEAALLTAVLVLWTRGPRLKRASTAAGMGVLLALALTLRSSALLWAASLWPAAWWTWQHGERRRLVLAGGPAMLASLLPLASVVPYVWDKLSARDRYVFAVDGLGEQVPVMVTWVLFLLGLGGLLARVRSGWTGPRRVLEQLAFGWLGITVVLVVVFRAGLDNHTLFAVALALGGALWLERWGHWALGLLVVQQGALWAGVSVPLLSPQLGPDTRDYNLPAASPDAAVLGALFAATCPQACVVAVEQGLFHPFSKGDERIEVLQTGQPQVTLVSVRDVGPRTREVAALASLRCTEGFADYHRLNPGDAVPAQRLEQQLRLEVVWTLPLDEHCTIAWEMAAAPAGLPASGPLEVPPRPPSRRPPPPPPRGRP